MKQINLRDSSLADSLEIVLEPRVMFDGAAVATAAQAADQVNQQVAVPEADSSDGKASHNLSDTHSDSEKNSDSERNVSLAADENTPPVVENTKGDKLVDQKDSDGAYVYEDYNPLNGVFGGVSKDGTVSWVVGNHGKIIVYELNDKNQFVKVDDLNLSSDDYSGATISDFVLGKDDRGTKGYVSLSDGRIVEIILNNNQIEVSKTISSNDAGLNDGLDLAISEDGKYLFAISSQTGSKVVSFDISTGQKVGEMTVNGGNSSLEYANGHLIATVASGMYGATVTISSIQVNDNGSLTGKVSFESSVGPNMPDDFHTAISSDGSKFALYTGNPSDGVIQIFDIKNGSLSQNGTKSSVTDTVRNISFDSSGNNIYVVSDDQGGTQGWTPTMFVSSYRINSANGLEGETKLDTSFFKTTITGVTTNDSGMILVTGDKTGWYTSNESGYFGQELGIGSQLQISDSELDQAKNWKGASVVINSSVTGGVYALSGSDYTVENGVVKDSEGNALATFSQNAPKDGSLTIKFTGAVTADQAKSIVKALTYRVDDGQPGRVALTVTVNDGSQDSSPVELGYVLAEGVSIDINGTGEKIPFNKEGTTLFPNADIKLADSDASNDQLKIESSDTGSSFDFSSDSDLTIDGQDIKKGGQTLGTVSQGNGVLTITFEKNATKDDVNAVLQHLVYKSDSINPGDDVSFSVTYTDRNLGVSRTVNDAAVVHENKAPYFNTSKSVHLTIESGVGVSYQFPEDLFKDDDDKSSDLTWDVEGYPDSLHFDSTTKKLTGNVPVDQEPFEITITVKDKGGLSASNEFHFEVAPNEPPVATNENSNFNCVQGDAVNVKPDDHFTDPNQQQKLNYKIIPGTYPKDLEINKEGVIEVSTDIAPGTYNFKIEASDGQKTAEKEFTLVVRSNSLPTLVSSWAQDGVEIQQGHCTVTAGEPVHLDLNKTIIDPDGDPVTIKDVKNLPEGLVFDDKNGTITGKVNGLINADISITVSDGRGTDTVLHLSFHSDNPPFTVPVSQFQHAPLYDPATAHELEEDLLMPVAPAFDLPDASIDLAGSSTPFATSQGLSVAMAALQASEPDSKGLSGAALLSAAQVAHSTQQADVAQPLHGMDQTGKAAPVRIGASMTLPTQGDKGTPVDEFLWQGSNVILDGTPSADGAPVVPSKVVPAQVSMAGKPALTEQVHERSAYGDEQPSAKA